MIEKGIWYESRVEDPPNAFAQSLSAEQRRILAQMLHDEGVSAIHDLLAHFTWWITTRHVGLTFKGEPMPIELSGDYVGINGWE